MNSIHRLSLVLVFVACSAVSSFAQTPAPTTTPEQPAPTPPTPGQFNTFLNDPLKAPLPSGPVTIQLDPRTDFPPGGPPYSLFSPFEFYVRPFGAVVEGTGSLSKVLAGGAGVDGGVRSFYYNADHSSAWYGDLGLGYQYNRGDDPSNSVIVRTGTITVTRNGIPTQVTSTTSLGVRELSRTEARIAFGREFYWHSTWLDCLYYSWGGDVGGVWGQASIKTDVNNRTGLQPGDVPAYNPNDFHSSEVTQGFFLGSSFNMIFPQRTHDFIVGTRVEWQREYFNHLVDNNNGTGQIKLMLEVGWRY
ncbi:MAG TPA: hypothetical protein PLN21_07605 [Gemmatales bacterium]|nr:hypothetical protein [Gemmatales bacterium]